MFSEIIWWDGGAGFFIGLRGGFEKHIPSFRHSGRSDKKHCRGGQVWKMLMLERVCPSGLAKVKDQGGQTTGVGHPRGM